MSVQAFPLLGEWRQDAPFEAALILMRDAKGRFALQLRDDEQGVAQPGRWCLFGGRVEAGESYGEAAVRELHEETGIRATLLDLIPLVRTISSTGGGKFFVFQLRRPVTPTDIRLGEGAGFGFLTRAQIGKFDLIPSIRSVLDYTFTLN
jgi:8-oxo-dGTP diphosphatase